jgi:hypothetical protein
VEFGNSFEEFATASEELRFDASPYIATAKTSLLATVIAAVGFVAYLAYQSGLPDWRSLPEYIVAIALICILAAGFFSLRSFAYLNSFSGPQDIVFSSSGVRIPPFLLGPFGMLRYMLSGGDLRKPIFLRAGEVNDIRYAAHGENGLAFRVRANAARPEIWPVHIDKSLIGSRVDALEASLTRVYGSKFIRPKPGSGYAGKIVLIAITAFAIAAGAGFAIWSAFRYGPAEQPALADRKNFDTDTEAEAYRWATPESPVAFSSAAPDDVRIEYWPNGRLKSREPLVDGRIEGIAEYRFENGALYGRIPYRNGRKHGAFILYHEDGAVDQELKYRDGQPHGVLRWRDPPQAWLYIDGSAARQVE